MKETDQELEDLFHDLNLPGSAPARPPATTRRTPPFTGQGSYQGKPQVRQFVRKQLSAGIQLDLTRKVLARERVTWTVGARDDRQETELHGLVEAEFRSGKVAALRLGKLPAV